MEKISQKEKELRTNNKKLALLDGWEISKEKFSDVQEGQIVMRNKEGYFLKLDEINYDESWDLLIPLYSRLRNINLDEIFRAYAGMDTNFMVGVSTNNIQQSFNALILMINIPNFKTK